MHRTLSDHHRFWIGFLAFMVAMDVMSAPLVIAHRGASGYRPEHTLESYRLAIEMGADYIEPDLVATRDGYLVARHEPEIGSTTDVASRGEFASRRRTIRIDGIEVTGWFTVDFTLAELKSLRAVQPRKDRSPSYDGLYEIPTLEEIITLAQEATATTGRTIGIYPETKHPSWHCTQGLALEPRLLAALDAAGWRTPDSPVFIQSFEAGNLRWLRKHTPLRLVQLLDGDGLGADGLPQAVPPRHNPGECALFPKDLPPSSPVLAGRASIAALAEIASYADAIGPWKRWIVGERVVDGVARATAPTDLIERAHAAGLAVHAWTFRDETVHLLADYDGDPRREYLAFAALGIDGIFSDHPDTAVSALRQLRRE